MPENATIEERVAALETAVADCMLAIEYLAKKLANAGDPINAVPDETKFYNESATNTGTEA